jgi:sulfite oxidase
MPKTERSIDELYAQDPERADATVFGRKTGPDKTGVDRRGFLGGAGLAPSARLSAAPFHSRPTCRAR